MNIYIEDDFNLDKITNSGQAFRIKNFEDGTYRFIHENHILYIRPDSNNAKHFDIQMYSAPSILRDLTQHSPDLTQHSPDLTQHSPDLTQHSATEITSDNEWNAVWVPYFDLNRSYSDIRKSVPNDDDYLLQAADYGAGLRILKQNPWEMLITFIISQRKNIPAIKESVEKICRTYGHKIATPFEELFIFPTAQDMIGASLEELKKCSLGYRDTYILDAVKRVTEGTLNLQALEGKDYDTVFNALLEVRGVGAKVSNCICLFAYSRFEAAPVDTWIAKVIDQYYNGINPFPSYGDIAGIMQQYIFYYAQTHKDTYK